MHADLFYSPNFKPLENKIKPFQSVFLIGSCFSNNISTKLTARKFSVVSNPYGILFDVNSISTALEEIMNQKKYSEKDLFEYNEMYHSWKHHSDFSTINPKESIIKINQTIHNSYLFLKTTQTAIITLGSSFSYQLKENKQFVANCHKYPQTNFNKILTEIPKLEKDIQKIIEILKNLNPSVQIIFTISPVRHLRDGAVENNRSKARLIEALNNVLAIYPDIYYFPAYEIVIDVLRDYRFFDTDFAHPNYLATEKVFEYFQNLCFAIETKEIANAMYQLYLAKNHKPKNPNSAEHQKFLKTIREKITYYETLYPEVNFSDDLAYFS